MDPERRGLADDSPLRSHPQLPGAGRRSAAHQQRSESGAYNSFYGWAANYLSQVLFTGPKGLQMLGQLDELIYDAVCAEQECVLFLSKGRRLVDVQRAPSGR